MLADPHFAAREAIVRLAHPELGELPMQSVFPRLSSTPGRVRHVGPRAGGAQRRGLPRPARPRRRRDGGTDRGRRDLTAATHVSRRLDDLPARCRRRRHLYRRVADRRADRRHLPRQDRLHAGRPVRRRAARDREGMRLGGDHARRRSPRSCTGPRSRPTRSWRARAPGSGWSPPRASARCCRSPGRSCRAGWPAGSSGPSPSRSPRWRTRWRRSSGSPPTAAWSPPWTTTTSGPSCAPCARPASRR